MKFLRVLQFNDLHCYLGQDVPKLCDKSNINKVTLQRICHLKINDSILLCHNHLQYQMKGILIYEMFIMQIDKCNF